jgi:hypothetical protein
MGGTLTLTRTRRLDFSTTLRGSETVGGWGVVLCTLLGPEGPGRLIFGSTDLDLWTFRTLRGVVVMDLGPCGSFGFCVEGVPPVF